MTEVQTPTGNDGLKVFLTGATGYIGGETLHQLMQDPALQQASITCLVRDSQKAGNLKSQYPRVKMLVADLDDEVAIRQQASDSDVVLNLANTRHLKSAQAIVQGFKDRVSADASKPAFWVQISGGTLLASDEIKQGKFGEQTDEVWNGLRDADKVKSVIRNNKGREVDNFALSAIEDKVNVALIVGPLIYGPGHGPGNKRSIQAPDMAKYILSKGHGFRLNAGLNRWSTIHVSDLASLITKLVVSSIPIRDSSVTAGLWNDSGLYLPETGVIRFSDLSKEIIQKARQQGLIQVSEPAITIDAAGADEVTPHGSILLGTNAVFDFSQAQQVPGWTAQNQTLIETLDSLVKNEATLLNK